MNIDPRIAAYVAELSAPGVPVVSRSHLTLLRLYQEHGKDVIDALLAAHWHAQRETNFKPMSFTPAQPGSAAAAAVVYCARCGTSRQYNDAFAEGWRTDVNGVPFQGYYCPACVAARQSFG